MPVLSRAALTAVLLALLMASSASASNLAAYGTTSKIAASSPGYVARLNAFDTAPVVVFKDGTSGGGVVSTDDTVYLLVVDPGTPGTVATNDVFLSGSSKGTKVTNSVAATGTATVTYCVEDTTLADGRATVGEDVFIAFDSDCTASVYLPLVAASGAGTLTATSPGTGTALATTSFGYVDGDASGGYSRGDQVYFRPDSITVDATLTSTGDVRIAPPSGKTFGTRPALGDLDYRGILIPQTANLTTASFLFRDDAGDGDVDTVDAIALDTDESGTKTDTDIIVATGTGCTTAGAACTATGTWDLLSDAAGTIALQFYDQLSDGAFNGGDSLYIHFGATTTVQVNDIRLSKYESTAAGRVVTGSPDRSRALTNASIDFEFLDKDNSADWTSGDLPYVLDNSLGAGGMVLPGMFRWHASASLAFGGQVLDTDKDAVLSISGGAAPVFAYYELDGDPGAGLTDPVILLAPGQTCTGLFIATDSRLSAGAVSTAAGTNLGSGFETGKSRSCFGTAPQFAVAPTPVTSYDTDSDIYLDAGSGPDADVTTRDVRVTASGAAAGTRPKTTDSDFSDALADLDIDGVNEFRATCLFGLATCPMAVGFVDSNADGSYQFLEPRVLDLDGDAFLTVGDVLLTGGSGSSSSGGGNAGNNGNTGSTDTATTTATGTSTDSSSDSGSSTSDTGSTSGGPDDDVGTFNQRIAASLEIEREDGENTLTWDPQDGAEGYQVFSSNSPFVLLTTLFGGGSSSYKDTSGDADTKYLVTAFVSNETKLSAADVNNGQVPGYSGVPSGEDAGSGGSKGFIPGFDLVVVLAAIGLALVAVRRRL